MRYGKYMMKGNGWWYVGAKALHATSMFAFAVCALALFFFRLGKKGTIPENWQRIYIIVAIIAGLILGFGGHWGATMVYVYGIGTP